MQTLEKRMAMERRLVRRLIRVAKKHGYSLIRIWDGECNERPKTEAEAMEVVFSVDDCRMVFKHPEQPSAHCAVIVLGNDGWDAIADASMGDGWDDVMAEMNEYSDKLYEEAA